MTKKKLLKHHPKPNGVYLKTTNYNTDLYPEIGF
ncbi:hypothetical protein J2Z57_003293 [Formosa algae]|uniref:Uncharacterized protein n=1 Tax=Formosa algae TaxID=225843 RepID=A0A9X0YMD5_9FLAO|nr:hypothetical protein [Formosa algae]MDQ0336836.1 hypothetical protein [Formosa algae]